MTTIYLDDFEDMDFKILYEHIMATEDTTFEVQKERCIQEDSEDSPDANVWSLFFDYYRAAFSGQKLAEIATTLDYWVPAVNPLSPFRFIVHIEDREVFADVLFYIIQGYFDMDAQEWETSFEHQATVFQEKAWNDEIDVACWGLMHIAADYLDMICK